MTRRSLPTTVACMLTAVVLSCGSAKQKTEAKPLSPETDPVVVVREPSGAAWNEARGLLIMLHGNDQTEDQLPRLWRDGYFYEPNFIMASVRAPFKGNRGFIWYSKSDAGKAATADDRWLQTMRTSEDRVMAICDSLKGSYKIDPERTHIGGVSLGASVAAFVYLRHTDVFNGLAIVAGSMGRARDELAADADLNGRPVFIAMGDAEGPRPREGANRDRMELAAAGANVRFFSHPEGHVVTQPIIRAMQNQLGLSDSPAPEVHKVLTSSRRLQDESPEEPVTGPDDEFEGTDE